MLIAVRIWILLSAMLVASGWILSAFHALNRAGYLIVFALVALAVLYWQHRAKWRLQIHRTRLIHKFRCRFKRSAPLLFLILAVASLVGGMLYPSTNGDSLAYRIPRVFHWLGQDGWHWIHTLDTRMNTTGCGFEWLSAPLFLFTRVDQCAFLVNWVSFLLLPGLTFSVFTRLGVRPRVAWWWMWLLASGWCYVFQAESDLNDAFATIYALAAVDFALRARVSGRPGDGWLSMLSATLLTGTKQTAIPLAVLWAVAAWPITKPVLMRPKRTLAVIAVALLISALPMMAINLKYTGNWMGTLSAVETPRWAYTYPVLDSPFWGIVGNVFCLAAQNLKPPIFPFVDNWNATMQQFLHTSWGGHFASFESFGSLDNGVRESNAGIGLGICLFTLFSLWQARELSKSGVPLERVAKPDWLKRLMRLLPWACLLVFMAKAGSYQNARHLAPYYVFLFPSLLVARGHDLLVHRIWWQRLGCLMMLISAVLLALSRMHPLFPAETLFSRLHEKYPQSTIIARLSASYSIRLSTQSQRNCFKYDLPPDEILVGYYSTFNCGAEPGLWEPFGRRRVERVLPGDTLEQLHSKRIRYIVVDEQALLDTKQAFDDWLKNYDGELVKQVTLVHSLRHLYLVRLR